MESAKLLPTIAKGAVQMSREKKYDALEINRIRCMVSIVLCTLLCVLVFLGVCEQLVFNPENDFPEVGWKSYHLFTILSNMLMAVSAAMCIPYAVDGLRNHNYHLPRWYVDLMYMGTLSVAVTFIIAITVLSAVMGFYKIMLWSNNLLLHTVCPLLALSIFFFFNSDHRLGFWKSLLAIAPVTAYALVYIIMVFVIGEEAGGWRDHYEIFRVSQYVSVPGAFFIFIVICFGLSNVLRIIHNAVHRRRKEDFERYYQSTEAYDYPDIESAIKALAEYSRPMDKGGELTLPRRAMEILEKKYRSGLSMEEMCKIYLSAYYN